MVMTTTAHDPESAQVLAASQERGWAIRTHDLTKVYGARTAVHSFNLEVPAGVVAGFVGPNGAGKTTTIRMLLSLIRPTTGTIGLLGSASGHSADVLSQVGAMIEGPAFYPGMSARRNLSILASLGGFDLQRVDPLLQRVGLAGREGDVVRSFSLGMRQRLGIAAALLPEPSLLILDEPTNGLDPAGIQEIRHLIMDLHQQGITILISSHLLSEVEQIADWIILINKGQLLYQGSKEALLATRHNSLVVSATDAHELDVVAEIARQQSYTTEMSNGSLRIFAPTTFARELNQRAMAAGVVLSQLTPERSSLEETFFSLTEGANA